MVQRIGTCGFFDAPPTPLDSRFDPHPSPLPTGEGDRRAVGLGVAGPFGTTGTHRVLTGATYPGSESGTCFRANFVPAGAGTPRV